MLFQTGCRTATSGSSSRELRKFVLLAPLSLLLASILLALPCAALNPTRNLDQYGHEKWTSQNGLPGEAVYEIVQSRDGYLWLLTSSGLVRFDGVRFVLVNIEVAGNLVDEPVWAICSSADGDLLVRTTTRTLHYRNGSFSDNAAPAKLPDGAIRVVFESRDHKVFIGCDDFVYVIEHGATRTLLRGTGWIRDFVETDDGTIWIGGANALYKYKGGALSRLPWRRSDVISLALDSSRRLWFGSLDGLYTLQAGDHADPRRIAGSTIRGEVNSILDGNDGTFWVGTTNSGLFRFADGHISAFSSIDAMTDTKVLSLLKDREGSLWVGTANGLDRFRDTELTTLTMRENLPSNDTALAVSTRDGSVYILCTGGGLARIREGKVTSITPKQGMPGTYGNGIFESRDGGLWIGTGSGGRGLTRYKDGKFTQSGQLSSYWVSAIGEDDESLIVAVSPPDVIRLKGGKIEPFTIEGQVISFADNYVFAIHRDSGGTLWFGSVKGLFKFAKGEPPSRARQSGVDFPVTSISEDGRGNLWLGGRTSGLTRFRIHDGQVTRYQKKDGLFDVQSTYALSDDFGNLWVSTPGGIYSAKLDDLDAFAEKRISSVPTRLYGTDDGMKSREASAPTSQPAGAKDRDGRLWFTTRKGVVVVDPKSFVSNKQLPPVVVESIAANGTEFLPRGYLQVPAGHSDLEFHYTALSLLVPSRVLFKYKLEGYDKDWIEAGSRRVAYYTNLPPGQYRFRVIASNNDGLWNSEGASLPFALRPHYYQTWWFYSLCAVLLAMVVVAVQRYYTRHLRLNAEILARRVEERTAQLAASSQKLAMHRTLSPLGVIEWDLNFRVLDWNPAAEHIFGFSREEALEQWGMDLLVPIHERPKVQQIWSGLLAAQTIRSTGENLTKDGRLILCEWHNTALVDAAGKVIAIASTVEDVTEERRLQEQFLQAQKMEAVGTLAGGVAHDFNNMLMVARSYAELLLDRVSDERTTRYAQRILDATGRAADLTRQLLAFSRKQKMAPRVLDLNSVVREMGKMLTVLLGENIELRLQLAEGLRYCRADATHLEQVIMNLAVNARDAMQQGGRLTITTVNTNIDGFGSFSSVPAGEYVVLQVEDTGAGISAEVLPHIFEPFYTTKEVGKGTGLGLSTVYGIVKQNGGYILVDSTPSQGTVFKICFPVTADEETRPVKESGTQAMPKGSATILLVDDEAALREAGADFLRECGYEVLVAANGKEAVDRAAGSSKPIDILVTDVAMPGLTGPELAECLQKSCPEMRVVYMTGYSERIHRDCSGVENQDYLQKPFSFQLLGNKLSKMLQEATNGS